MSIKDTADSKAEAKPTAGGEKADGKSSRSSSSLGGAGSASSSSLNSQQLGVSSSSSSSSGSSSSNGDKHKDGGKKKGGGGKDKSGSVHGDKDDVVISGDKGDVTVNEKGSGVLVGGGEDDVIGGHDGRSEYSCGSVYSGGSSVHPVVFMYTPPKRTGGGGGAKPKAAAATRVKASGKATSATNSQEQQQALVDRDGGGDLPRPATAAAAAAKSGGGGGGGSRRPQSRRPQGKSVELQIKSGRDASNGDRGGGGRRGRRKSASDDDTNVYKDKLRQAKADLEEMKDKAMHTERLRSKRLTSAKQSRGNRPLKGFNCSDSYCDTQVIDFYIKKDISRRYYPTSKRTATTLVDPWVDLAQQSPAERVRRPKSKQRQQLPHRRQTAGDGGSARRDTGGGDGAKSRDDNYKSKQQKQQDQQRSYPNRTPLPVVDFNSTAEYWRRPVSFVELPKIRARIREAHAATGSRRRRQDYARTAADCRCLELDGLDRLPGRRSGRSLARCCSAYLSGAPGSRAALGDCLERVRSRSGRRWDSPSGSEDEGGGGGGAGGGRRSATLAMAQRSCAESSRARSRKQPAGSAISGGP